MTDPERPSLGRSLERLRWQLATPVDFTRSDTESTVAKVRLLCAAASYFNVLVISDFGGRQGPIRQEGLVEHVVAAAFQTFGNHDPHPTPFEKAAMLMRGIIQGHPFNDANKRTGFLLAIYYLDRMGYDLRPQLSPAEVVSLCRQVSAGELRDLKIISAALQAWTEPRRGHSMAR
jgi:death-on-curing protein